MPDIAEPVRSPRILRKPRRFKPLRAFSSGRQGHKWEKTVNEWARGLWKRGTRGEPQTVVILEDAHGKLLGVCGFKARPLLRAGEPPILDAQYIVMFGIDRFYQGKGMGTLLLRGVLDHIKATCGGRLPHVWAYVHPDNEISHAMFRKGDFREVTAEGDGDAVEVRAPRPEGEGPVAWPA